MRGCFTCTLAFMAIFCTNAFAQTADSSEPLKFPSKVKTFVIEPDQSDQAFMCQTGRVQSVQVTAIAEHRIVSIVLVDQGGLAIPDGEWRSAFGFHLAHHQSVKINAIMFCGN
jgi:hypothetical protein